MSTRGETAQPAEDWMGAAAMVVYLWNTSPEHLKSSLGDEALGELYRNMPDAIRDMGNNFIEKMGAAATIP